MFKFSRQTICALIVTVAATASSLVAQADSQSPIEQAYARQGYQATVVHSLNEVWQLFKNERQLNHKSQCHERAEVWSYELNDHLHANLMKVMMFYTPRFRTTFKHKGEVYQWWYHTAPVVYADLSDGRGPVAYVLDQEFLDQPVTLDEWSYFFLHDEIEGNGHDVPYVDEKTIGRSLNAEETKCQVISNFREFAVPALKVQMNTPYCMMRIYPMYYMQPDDVMLMDCDPEIDTDYTLGLTGRGWLHPAKGADVLERFKTGNLAGRYKIACPKGSPITLERFRSKDLDVALEKTKIKK